MMRYISPKDQKLAQKHRLGTPTRKYRLSAPRLAHLSKTPSFFSFLQTTCAMVLGLLAVVGGLYVDISTTIMHGVGWMWLALLAVAAVPITFGVIMHSMGHQRLVLFNTVAAFLSFFLVTIYNGIFRVRMTSIDPLTSLLSGLFILCVGLGVLAVGYHSLSTPWCVLICTDGCLVMNRGRRGCILHWNRIAAIWHHKYGARIVCEDGTKCIINYHWHNGVVVRDIIYRKALRYIRARALAAYEAGEQVQFGKYRLSQQGISIGAQFIPWEQVRECEYMEDTIALIGQNDLCLDRAPLRSLPNAVVFVSLVNSLVPQHV